MGQVCSMKAIWKVDQDKNKALSNSELEELAREAGKNWQNRAQQNDLALLAAAFCKPDWSEIKNGYTPSLLLYTPEAHQLLSYEVGHFLLPP